MISTNRFTERLSRKLKKAGIPKWIGQASADTWGKYLLFRIGGTCTGSAGWTQAEAIETVNRLIEERQAK